MRLLKNAEDNFDRDLFQNAIDIKQVFVRKNINPFF